MGYFLQPTTAAPAARRVPVHNSDETAKNEVPEYFTVNSGRRFYSPELGRWLSRDPIGERGEANLQEFVFNQPISQIDLFGETAYSATGQRRKVKPPDINCEGYRKLFNRTCEVCYGKKLASDTYPESAYEVCEGFRMMYTGEANQSNAACVAECLIAMERRIQRRYASCSDRNCARLGAHAGCYQGCGFIPHKGFPEGAFEVGVGLLPSCASRGLF